MRHRYVPKEKEVIAMLGRIQAECPLIQKEYHWIEPGLYNKDRLAPAVKDDPRPPEGSVSDPTGDIATGAEYERRRNCAREVMVHLEIALTAIQTAKSRAEAANPRYEVAEPEVHYPEEISPRKNRRLQEQLAYQAKRLETGVE